MASLTNALHLPFSLLIFGIFQLLSIPALATNGWQSIAPGVEYQDLPGKYLAPWSHIHVFRISLKKNTFSSLSASTFSRKLATAEVFAQKSGAILAINGGFFDSKAKPLGLRLSDFQQQNPLKPISWWGVFYIQNKKPFIQSYKNYSRNNSMEFAIQSGPRLLVDNQIMPLKPGIAERTALGITQNRQVIILVTENAAMSTSELAKLLQSEPLSCVDALNLDGGGSTQMYLTVQNMVKKVTGYTGVSDAVIIKPR